MQNPTKLGGWVLSLFHSHRMCGQNNLWLSTNQMILGSASVWVLLDVQDKLVFAVYNWQMTLELLVVTLSLQPSHSLGSSCNAPLPTNRDLHILWTSLSSVGWQWHPSPFTSIPGLRIMSCFVPCEFYLTRLRHESWMSNDLWLILNVRTCSTHQWLWTKRLHNTPWS